MGLCCSKAASRPVSQPLTQEEREIRRTQSAQAAEARSSTFKGGGGVSSNAIAKQKASSAGPGDSNRMMTPSDWN